MTGGHQKLESLDLYSHSFRSLNFLGAFETFYYLDNNHNTLIFRWFYWIGKDPIRLWNHDVYYFQTPLPETTSVMTLHILN